jgi:hypothetical protein
MSKTAIGGYGDYKPPKVAEVKRGVYTPRVKTYTPRPKARGRRYPGLPK